MKLKDSIYTLALLVLGSLSACLDTEVEAPRFEVSTLNGQKEFKAGDSIQFLFSGDPDIITFYSGEKDHMYQHRNRTELEGGTLNLEFISRVLYGSEATIRLLASTNFSGVYDTTNVKAATWQDISDRFTWAIPTGGVGAETPSGQANISDLLVSGKPLYLAYQYVGKKPPGTTATQRTWRITSFSLTNSFADGTVAAVSTLATAGWLNVDFIDPNNEWKYANGYLQLAPNFNASRISATEDWAISKPFNPNKVSPDRGVAIKEYTRSKPDYKYAYSHPGTYTVSFVASNATIKGQEKVVKELEIIVTE